MSKVFFFNIPFHGHVNPSLGLVRELVKNGEEVIYYCNESFRGKIESTGAVFRGYSDKFYLDENYVTYNLTDLFQVHLELSALILDELIEDVKKDKPAYIIHDTMCPWGKHLSKITNIPAVNTFTTLALEPDGFFLTAGFALALAFTIVKNIPNMTKIRKTKKLIESKYNIKVSSLLDIVLNKEELNLVYTSKEFQPKSEKLIKRYRFVGPSSMYRIENMPELKLNRNTDRPLIFISMGTIFNNNIEFFNICTKAFENMDIDVLMSVGKSIDIPSLSIPDNFTVKYYFEVPQLEILKECNIFMTHGGMNSTQEGLFFGVPLIIIPQQQEQAHVAMQVVRSGSGICLKKSKITSELLKNTVDKIMSDRSYRENALRMRDSFIKAGGPGKAVKEILLYVGRKKIINTSI
ncbi:macrolide family glycosyltransferase [Ruminiclostridium cellulolyticum]|uniref:Glycosyltransferase, MGT family n=1 Tax=Ruminiclostridium cellulolyticum (strain ATCC 35319 / DSM 5812 / JCM 6584 / H10) TaxID=394503 RepID=B8I5C5_RUMCH|nr:macrolide family glycosyltransferase [Ruminiclostridium cellulolyticum]ACL76661.1 glycosyltransferase, MGT family [Ruminiclostridium cellulolyticum H10]